jgi:hypothetical protein
MIRASILDWGHTLGELKLNLDRFCLECLVELTFFRDKRVLSVSTCRRRPNLWNLHLHLQELKNSELSLMIFDLSDACDAKFLFSPPTDFAFGCHCWLHARDSITLPENQRCHDCFDFVFDFITVDTFSSVVCKVLGECICLGITAGFFPIWAKVLTPALYHYHLPCVVNVLTGSLFEVVLSFTDEVLVAEFAVGGCRLQYSFCSCRHGNIFRQLACWSHSTHES